jgi:hypothetical protein
VRHLAIPRGDEQFSGQRTAVPYLSLTLKPALRQEESSEDDESVGVVKNFRFATLTVGVQTRSGGPTINAATAAFNFAPLQHAGVGRIPPNPGAAGAANDQHEELSTPWSVQQ